MTTNVVYANFRNLKPSTERLYEHLSRNNLTPTNWLCPEPTHHALEIIALEHGTSISDVINSACRMFWREGSIVKTESIQVMRLRRIEGQGRRLTWYAPKELRLRMDSKSIELNSRITDMIDTALIFFYPTTAQSGIIAARPKRRIF
ncbi:hypothetical protein GTZ97_03870 [Aquabacterium fontiphilum]|uniref:hypothetical protein n=1 Tax=Aquabacterium fontiphilum TaxID=450365 RepID=UPI001378611E|nr:hypothetical protein [Aquabacterium fontiphilum]NBD19809.1 hypothetical protein [Aquabacterium fontiphilum]